VLQNKALIDSPEGIPSICIMSCNGHSLLQPPWLHWIWPVYLQCNFTCTLSLKCWCRSGVILNYQISEGLTIQHLSSGDVYVMQVWAGFKTVKIYLTIEISCLWDAGPSCWEGWQCYPIDTCWQNRSCVLKVRKLSTEYRSIHVCSWVNRLSVETIGRYVGRHLADTSANTLRSTAASVSVDCQHGIRVLTIALLK